MYSKTMCKHFNSVKVVAQIDEPTESYRLNLQLFLAVLRFISTHDNFFSKITKKKTHRPRTKLQGDSVSD